MLFFKKNITQKMCLCVLNKEALKYYAAIRDVGFNSILNNK